jgi:hypothetical protein
MRGRAAWAASACLLLALATGCGSDSDSTLRATLRRGVDQIRSSTSATTLRQELRRTLASLRNEHVSSEAERLAIAGFEQTLEGVEAQIDFIENDRGEIEAATRDAMRSERHRKRGANLLRAAGRALDVPVGPLKGY